MPIENFLRKLKQGPVPARNVPGTAGDTRAAAEASRQEAAHNQLLDLGHKLLVELKYQGVGRKPLYRSHLDRLENPGSFRGEDWAVGYSLERIARKISPRLTGRDLSRPTLCMVCVGDDYARTVEIGTRTKTEYCENHGYNLAILEERPYRYDRPTAWLKIPLIFRLMQLGYDRIFFLDADTAITDPRISLEPFFERLEKVDRHLMIAEDIYTLNTGSFFMRRTWQSQVLLDLIYETDAEVEHGFWEQQALIHLVEQYAMVRSVLHIEPDSRQFNSMPFDGPPSSHWPSDYLKYAWQPGDFLCHFAGNRNKSDLAAKMAGVLKRASGVQAECSKLEGTGK